MEQSKQAACRARRDIRGNELYSASQSLPRSACRPARMAQEVLEEIVVTARFREENLQQTPLAITAITGDTLESRGATSTLDLDAFVPNAVIAPLGAGWGSTAAAFIRGIGLGDNSLSFEPGVPIYIDDVYHGRPQGAVMDLLDVERVEVLRGPQGTLFGKNTLGGAVRIISRKPEGDGTGFLDRRRRLARPVEPARLVRLRARRGNGVRARVGVVEDAGRLLRHPRLRVRERRGLARARRPRHHGRRLQRCPAARDADLRRRGVVAARRHDPPRDRRRRARQRGRTDRRPRLRRRSPRQRERAVGPRRACGSWPPTPWKSTSSPTSRASINKGRPTSTRCNCARRTACRPRWPDGHQHLEHSTSRFRCSAPAGSSTADSKLTTSTRDTTASASTRCPVARRRTSTSSRTGACRRPSTGTSTTT